MITIVPMKTLYIIRHAKSDWNDPSLSDFQRPLNKRGEKNAPFMGELLAREMIHPDLILSSPAVRAKTTAEEIAQKVGYERKKIIYKDDLYMGGIHEIEGILKKISDSTHTVFLIAHNPGLTDFAEYVSGYVIDNIPTCGIFCVRLKDNEWKSIGKDAAVYVSFEYPKKYQNG